MRSSDFTALVLGIILVVLIVAFATAVTTSADEAHQTLSSAGFTDVVVGDWAFFACGRDDKRGREFTATNPAGKHVSGVVCCGILKSCTVRF